MRVVRRIADDRYRLEIFGCGAQQRDAADVDLLDGHGLGHLRSADGRDEGIEVADDEVNGGDPVVGQLGQMLGRAAGQDAAVDGGV